MDIKAFRIDWINLSNSYNTENIWKNTLTMQYLMILQWGESLWDTKAFENIMLAILWVTKHKQN